MTDLEKHAEESAKELKKALASTIEKVDKAAEEFREACEKTSWENEPYYYVAEAIQKLGVALANLVQWEEAGNDNA